MRGSAVFRTGIAPSGALAGPWVRNPLWTRARAVPSLDLRFADNKSLVDAVTGASLVTFTRASSGTFVGSDGVLRSAVTNLLLRSEEFGTTWSPNNITISPDAIAAPNGTLTADKLIATTTNGAHQLYQVASGTSGVTYTISFYVKEGEYKRFRFGPGNTAVGGADKVVEINLALSNPIVSQEAIFNSSAFVISVGNGWYRVGATFTATATGTMTVAVLQTLINNAGSSSFAGDGTSGIYAWGAMLEQSSTVGEYIPTTSAINSAPRFDHNPTTGESLGLLVEEARTNSIRNNTGVGAVSGTPGTLPTNWTQSNNTGLAANVVGTGTENGITYIDLRVNGTTTGTGQTNIVLETSIGVAATTGQTWSLSSYLKIQAGSLTNVSAINLVLQENTAVGTAVTAGAQAITIPTSSLGTYRPTFTRTLSGGVTVAAVMPYIQININTGLVVDFTLRIGLPQLEQGAFATSVIPTTTATVTRAADVASIGSSAFTSFYNQSEGTFYADTNLLAGVTSTNRFVFEVNDGVASTGDKWDLRRTGGSAYRTQVRDGGVSNSDQTISTSANPLRIAVAADSSAVFTSANGTATSSAVKFPTGFPTVDRLFVGGGIDGSTLQTNGTIKRLVFWPPRLSNEVLQRITQP